MNFRQTINSFLDHYGLSVDVTQLTLTDKRRALAAYLKDNPDLAYDIIADIPPKQLAKHVIDIVRTGYCDDHQLEYQVFRAAMACDGIESLIDGELDLARRNHERYERETA